MVDRTRTAEIMLAVGGDQLFLGRYKEAIARFHEALRIDPNCVEAYTWMGRAYMDWGRLDEAAKAWREALRLHPENTLAHYHLGDICIRCGNRPAAHKHYLALRDLHPIRAERLWARIQEHDAGEKTDERADEPPPASEGESESPSPSAEATPEKGPPRPDGTVEIHIRRAADRAKQPKPLEGAPTDPSRPGVEVSDQETVDETPEKSVEKPSIGPEAVPNEEYEFDAAETEILDDASATPGESECTPEAEKPQEDAQEPDEMKTPGEPHDSAYTGLTEDGEAALSELERWKRAVESDPRDADAHWRLGRCYLDSGEHALAAESIEQAIANRRDFAGSHPESVRDSVEMCLALGNCYERLGRFERAVDIYEQALALEPENPEAHLRLGLVALVLNNRGEAVERYRTLVRIDPSRARPFLERLLQVLSK